MNSEMATMSKEEYLHWNEAPQRRPVETGRQFIEQMTGHGPEQTAPQIGVELEHLHKAVAHITDQVNELLDRIGPVMAPVNAGILEETGKESGPPMSPIAMNLAGVSTRLHELALKVQSARMVVQL